DPLNWALTAVCACSFDSAFSSVLISIVLRILIYNSVTQPCDALATVFAYLYNTPLLTFNAGCFQFARRAAISSSDSFTLIVLFTASISMISSSSTSPIRPPSRSEEHTSELQSRENLVCRLLRQLRTRLLLSFPTRRSSDL